MNPAASRMLASRGLLAGAALAGGGVCLHWLATMPPPAITDFKALSPLGSILAKAALLPGVPRPASLGLYAILAGTGVLAALLSAVLLARSSDQRAARYLAMALSLGAASAAYFFIACTFPPGSGWIAAAGVAGRFLLDLAAYVAGSCGLLALLRFFAAYPRDVTPDDWFRFQQAEREGRLRKVRTSWRRHILSNRTLEGDGQQSRLHRFGQSLDGWFIAASIGGRGWLVAIGLGTVMAFFDLSVRNLLPPGGRATAGSIAAAAGFLGSQAVVIPIVVLIVAAQLLKLQHRNGTPEDRRRIDWIYATMFVGGVGLLAIPIILMVVGIAIVRAVPGAEEWFPMGWFFPLPMVAAPLLFFLAFVIALIVSVFYRGTVDPRLMARRVTLWGALALLVTFIFVLLERVAALQLVTWLGLPSEMGPLLAGAGVAATFAPLRARAERIVTDFVSRFLPIELLADGPRRMAAVAFADLSGYTRLCARDERQGLLLGALLHRQAERVSTEHGGRMVRSIGDAVMLEFASPSSAARALPDLHRRFPEAARAMGLEPLPVHTGAHYGEVVAPRDDDLFGMTVNLAARLQDAAGPGLIVVSEAFRLAAGLASGETRALGMRQFKNVPEQVDCHELAVSGL